VSLLTPVVTTFVHAINAAAHPSIPPGWRWAVHLGDPDPERLDGCANAGWCPTENEAALEGEMVAVTVVKSLRMFGIPVEYQLVRLDRDPIPVGADLVSLGGC
jgi:hypothetical protein